MWIRLLKVVGEHKVGDFLDVDEATSRAYVAAGLAEDGGNGPEHHLMRTAMAEFRAEMAGIVKGTADTIRQTTQELARNRPSVIEPGEAEADRTRGVGDYLRNVVTALDGSQEPEARQAAHERLTKVYGCKRGMAEGAGSTGGYSTPVLYEQQMFKVAAEQGVLTPDAREVPLGAREVEWPALDQYQVPTAGQSAVFGGVKVYRKTESAQRTASQPALSKVKLVANDLTAYTEFSRDLLADNTAALDSAVPELVGQAIGWREDWEGLNGNGSGQFLGMYNAPCTIQVTRNTSSRIKYVDVVTILSRLLPMSMNSPKLRWIAHPYTIPELLQIQDPAGRYIFLQYQTPGEGTINPSPKWYMLGIPVKFTEKAPTLGNAGDLSLADADKYLVGRRSGLEIGLSEHFKFDTDQVAIRAKLRNDGQPWLKKAITLADGTNTASGFVVLN
jgi:HK97 family phage major capsid protein